LARSESSIKMPATIERRYRQETFIHTEIDFKKSIKAG
jgi:hypothetical protein